MHPWSFINTLLFQQMGQTSNLFYYTPNFSYFNPFYVRLRWCHVAIHHWQGQLIRYYHIFDPPYTILSNQIVPHHCLSLCHFCLLLAIQTCKREPRNNMIQIAMGIHHHQLCATRKTNHRVNLNHWETNLKTKSRKLENQKKKPKHYESEITSSISLISFNLVTPNPKPWTKEREQKPSRFTYSQFKKTLNHATKNPKSTTTIT